MIRTVMRSLRWQIQIYHALILALLIVAFAGVLYTTIRWHQLQQIDQELAAATEVLWEELRAKQIDRSTPLQGIELEVPGTFSPRRVRHRHELPYYVVWLPDGTRVQAINPHADVCPVPVSKGQRSAKNPRTRESQRRGRVREAFKRGDDGMTVLVGRFIEPDLRQLDELLLLLIGVGLIIFSAGLIGGFILSARAVKPIQKIVDVSAEISEHQLSDRIDTTGMSTELSQLSSTLNDTFDRLQASFERQRQFTADASHELRTPLSAMQVHQQLALARQRSAEDYRQTIETCQRSTGRMIQLVQSLLTLARCDSGTPPDSAVTRQSFDLGRLVDEMLEPFSGIAIQKGSTIVTELSAAFVTADREQIAQVVTNLISNAMMHCPAETHVIVRVQQQDNEVVFQVKDNGPGIPDDEQAKIFERFYRTSQSRSRDEGGSGLGLSICQAIIRAHGGTLTVRSFLTQGSEFEFRLAAD